MRRDTIRRELTSIRGELATSNDAVAGLRRELTTSNDVAAGLWRKLAIVRGELAEVQDDLVTCIVMAAKIQHKNVDANFALEGVRN